MVVYRQTAPGQKWLLLPITTCFGLRVVWIYKRQTLYSEHLLPITTRFGLSAQYSTSRYTTNTQRTHKDTLTTPETHNVQPLHITGCSGRGPALLARAPCGTLGSWFIYVVGAAIKKDGCLVFTRYNGYINIERCLLCFIPWVIRIHFTHGTECCEIFFKCMHWIQSSIKENKEPKLFSQCWNGNPFIHIYKFPFHNRDNEKCRRSTNYAY